MRGSWKVWVAGIALVQLLIIGVDAALLWPTPSHAQQAALRIRVGMTDKQWREATKGLIDGIPHSDCRWDTHVMASYHFGDGSYLCVTIQPPGGVVSEISVLQLEHVAPPPFWRRIMARLIPSLKE